MDNKDASLDFEKRLNEFRARRRRQELIDNAKKSLTKVVSFMETVKNSEGDEMALNKNENNDLSDGVERKKKLVQNKFINDETNEEFDYVDLTSEASADSFESADLDISTCWNWSKIIVYSTLWLSLFGLAVYAEFGFVFVILSGFVLIWFNTRTGPKRRGEISAYSVFNPNCEPIDGTIDARQFEREIRGGIGGIGMGF